MIDPLAIPTRPGSPARMTASATIKLPRWGVILLCLLYILPGLIGRDPWKSEDAIGFGLMWTMAEGRGFGGWADWLMPNVVGAMVFDNGPLMFWLGAVCIKLFGWLVGAAHAARLASVSVFFIAATSIWYGTYLLGRRPDVQPHALAFGGQPQARDYGRMLADGALLILLGTIGLLRRSHESSSDMVILAMLSLSLYAMARSLDKPRIGAFWMALALGGLGLSDGPGALLAISMLWVVLLASHSEWRQARWSFFIITIPLGAVILALWPVLTYLLLSPTHDLSEAHNSLTANISAERYFTALLHSWQAYFSGITHSALIKYFRALPWFTWLAWPLAAWAVWSWRHRIRNSHMALTGGYVIAIALLLCATPDTSDGQLLMLLPGLVMLAAFGLPTLKRSTANAIDWFSLLMFSLFALALWFSWFTRMTGWPPAWAKTIARQTPGFVPEFHVVVFILAALATVAWFWLVHWRIVKHPKVLWRSVVLSSGGLVLIWILVNTLFLHSVNYSRTYRDVAVQIAAKLEGHIEDQCVLTDGLGLAQRASFAYFSDLHFALDNSAMDLLEPQTDTLKAIGKCRYLLRQDLVRQAQSSSLPPGHWKMIWEGRRASDKDERFRLYLRD